MQNQTHIYDNFYGWSTSSQIVIPGYLAWSKICTCISNITTLRSHKLEIEKGRYMNIPAEQRICRLCKLDVENEIHFLLECPSLANTRREILDQIESRFSNLKFLENKSKFVWLLSADDHYFYNQLYALLTTLYNKRNDILSSNTH
jgi:hypothetical protein